MLTLGRPEGMQGLLYLSRNMLGIVILLVLLSCHSNAAVESNGFKNNINNPTWGMAESRLLRLSPASYSDGAYRMSEGYSPNPMDVSMGVNMGPSGLPSDFSRNALQAFYAQLILDEMVHVEDLGCPPEYENLDIPHGHPLENLTDRPQVFQRSMYDQSSGYTSAGVRQHLNQASSFLDGSVIYGTYRLWTNLLRSFQDGRLKADTDNITSSFPAYNNVKLPLRNPPVPKHHSLKNVDRLFRLGNPAGHENPFLLALQIVWFRWHNVVAHTIAQSSSDLLTDEQIFQKARQRVVGHFQKIAWTEWLPHFLFGDEYNTTASNTLPKYTGYDSTVHPGVNHEFLVAMGYRYTITPSAVWTLGGDGSGRCVKKTTEATGSKGEYRNVTSMRMCNYFWDSQDQVKSTLDEILRGMVFTRAEKEDETIVSDFTNHFYGPYEFSRTDHVASILQRSRDHGVPPLNDIRSALGLDTLTDWTRLQGTNGKIHKLYGGTAPDPVDLLTGGLADTNRHAGMSDVFRTILSDQFKRTRDGDRFWYQNKRNGLFSDEEIETIESTTFHDILLATTAVTDNELPSNVFLCQATTGQDCSCYNPPSTDDVTKPYVDVCTPLETHDYISGSEWSFALSFLGIGLVFIVSVLVLMYLIRRKNNLKTASSTKKSMRYSKANQNFFRANEWLGQTTGFRKVKGEFQVVNKRIVVKNEQEKYLRYLELVAVQGAVMVKMSSDRNMLVAGLRVDGDTDLILQFDDYTVREAFIKALQTFLTTLGIEMTTQLLSESDLFQTSLNKDKRQKILDAFFRVVCQQALEGEMGDDDDAGVSTSAIMEVMHVKLTINEFAEALGMLPSSLFVTNIFLMADKKRDRHITFQEFRDLFAVFLKGTAEDKARLLFNIYDLKHKGYLTGEDFQQMIKSLLDLADSSGLSDTDVSELCTSMFTHVGLKKGKKMRFGDFKKVFCSEEYAATLQSATITGQASNQSSQLPNQGNLGIHSRRQTMARSYRTNHRFVKHNKKATSHPSESVETLSFQQNRKASRGSCIAVSTTSRKENPRSATGQRLYELTRFVDRYRWHIFWLALYTLVTIGIFVERAYYYARGREHTGLRRMSGEAISAAIRGSASVIMFTYVSLLVTMCRNFITVLRETFLHRFVPFDSAVTFHKYVAVLAMIATIIHIIGHAINLYNMSTQSPASLNCFFSEFYTESHNLPYFHYWLFQTITGLAGVGVTILIIIMYVFATQYSRRNVFKSFWTTHSLYWLVYLLTILHGIGRLVQAPLFPWYLAGPLILFCLDKLKSVSRKKVEIAVMSATPLQSGVLRLIFRKPPNVTYRSGQWVRIACLALSKSEYHPFTLTSAPHETTLSLHIRAVGPWTTALRKVYSTGDDDSASLPMLYLDGPFGEGHQDWYTFDVSILVGGGIGVTPFASILKDIAFKSRIGQPFSCKKVFFIWVTRTQKSFEWLVEILREVEAADVQEIVNMHIFVTQYPQKYDLRTTMLYICERHFQKLEGKSLFTGLKAMTHFGRPKFEEFFASVTQEFNEISQVGVFSCGPGAMTSTVQKACTQLNSISGPTFNHHFENF